MHIITIVVSVIYIICKLVYIVISEFIKGRNAMKKARATNKAMLKTVETGLKNSKDTIFYQVQGYSNKGSLKQFVNLMLPVNSEYKVVNKELNYYLFSKGAKYTLVKYWGKKAEYKGTIVISDMGQMYLEEYLSKTFNRPIKLEQVA